MSGFGFSNRPKLRIEVAIKIRCRICGHFLDDDYLPHLYSVATIANAGKYHFCPVCFKQIEQKDWTRSYKLRWSRYVNRHL